ncbi:GNAT family N-acetyltransferase [Flammeovirga agarivorans]|uniref:GNAT family N-acetyltransferase n=1 Tax=Flammeovirga agarivorans TaxID=2726742 RepID=A0A7X8SR07_9BACT|nr:GNAT family N-acetyltransferase [Flammeovirga agarivorans]NLR94688.1 GNAT family N-acetyltransferase [Flammeovirga agarivorans]
MVRQATANDLDQLSVLFDGYRVFYRKTSDLSAARAFLAERIALKDSKIYVFEEEGQLSGFVQLYPLFSSTRMKKLWLLNDLYVDASQRGKGVSLKLIDEAKKLAYDTNACGVMLETEITNQIGNKLYPRTGFELNQSSNFYEWSVE